MNCLHKTAIVHLTLVARDNLVDADSANLKIVYLYNFIKYIFDQFNLLYLFYLFKFFFSNI